MISVRHVIVAKYAVKDMLADLHVGSQVLSIGETVEEVSDSGFLPQAPTLKVQLLADDSMLQVDHPALPPVIPCCQSLARTLTASF